MSAAASQESKRSWRGAPRGTLVRRSRHFWRWLLSGLALVMIAAAVYWAWPRPLPRTMLLMLTSDREERTLPLLPYVEGDRKALLQWAHGAKVPVCQRQLIEVTTPRDFVQRLIGNDSAASRFAFTLEDRGTELRLSNSDMLVLYLKGHGLALDVSVAERPDVRPLMIKSLSEADLAGRWWSEEGQTIDVAALLKELSKQPELKKLVILDAVHLNYDPRLGTLINSFPQAVKQAVEQLPQRTNLWVLVGQSDGELGVGMPGTGRSAFVDSVVSLLQRDSKGAAAIDIDSLVTKMQSRLNDLAMSGRGSFRQTLQRNFPASSANVVFRLPTSPPPAADGAAKANSPSVVAAKAAQAVPAASGAVATAQQVAASPAAKDIQTAASGSAAVQGDAKASPAPAATPQGQPPATGATDSTKSVAGTPTAAAATAPPTDEVPKTDLDLAWEARDRLRARYREGWSPAHIAPDAWRRVEGLLAGFDEEGLSRERQPRDQATLELLRRDLELLEGVFRGQSGAPSTEQCRTIADALSRFPQTEAYRSFQARKAGGLDAANDALRVLAEGIYRAHDYVWLHGQMLVLLDGGPLASEVPLESLLDNLRTLRGLLSPAGLSEGRLTDARARELSKAAQDVEALRQKIDDDVAAYAKSTAAAPQSPGRQLRAQLLLHSPLLAADVRRALRSSTAVAGEAKPDSVRSSSFSVSDRLAANLRLSRKLFALALPLSSGSGRDAAKGAASAGVSRLCGSIDSADTKGDLLSWAAIGRRFREQAEELPAAIQAEASTRSAGPVELSAANMFDLYLFTLLIDGRDAQHWRSSRAPLVTLGQPLLPELITDRVDLAASTQRLKLRGPAGEVTSLTLSVQVQSERPPPYPVTLELNWEPRDVEIKRQSGGAALRAGRNDLLLDSDKLEIGLQVISQRDSKEAFTSLVRAQARFASAPPARADIACLLPRPDQVDVTIATDDNLEAAKRRTWFPHGEQGGRLSFFANRERSYSIYLTNVSSEEKRLTARLYRVPPWAAGPGGRLFDPRATSQLLPAAANLDGRLTQVGADPAQILRDFLVAQSNEKEPLVLTSSGVPLKVPLTATVAAPMPPPSPAAPPAAKGEDVTDGLLLVLTSADGKGKPFFKWIELQMLQPDDLLEIKEQRYRDDKLSFRVGLKDPKLVEEMGLAKQPLIIAWDGQSLPRAVREATKEAQIAASGATTAEFSATVDPVTIRWPVYVQLYVDRDPRGLVASLDRQRDSLTLSNLKENRPPVAHTWRVATVAARSHGPAEKSAVMIRPQAPWLPYPSFATVAEGLPLHEPRQPIMIRVDERTPTVKLETDVGADVAQKYFADGARVRVAVEQQTKDFATDRQIHVRLTGTDGGVLQVASDVSDFTRIEFDSIDVPQDKRIDLVADVVGERVGFASADSGPDIVPIILDRTPPLIGPPGVQKTDPQAVAPNKPPQSKLIMACRTDDGQGSGIAKVEFHMGFDLNRNDRIDENERMPPIPALGGADGIYSAEYLLPNDPPGEHLLIEAVATDNVGLTSAPGRYAFVIPRKVEGGQRTTFGGKKVEEPPPQGKKRP